MLFQVNNQLFLIQDPTAVKGRTQRRPRWVSDARHPYPTSAEGQQPQIFENDVQPLLAAQNSSPKVLPSFCKGTTIQLQRCWYSSAKVPLSICIGSAIHLKRRCYPSSSVLSLIIQLPDEDFMNNSYYMTIIFVMNLYFLWREFILC